MRSILCWPWKAYPMSYHQSPKAIRFTKANLILHRECINEKCRMSSALHVQSHWRQSSPWTLDEVSNFIHTAFFVTFASLGHEGCDYYDVSIIIFLTDRSTKVRIIRVWKYAKVSSVYTTRPVMIKRLKRYYQSQAWLFFQSTENCQKINKRSVNSVSGLSSKVGMFLQLGTSFKYQAKFLLKYAKVAQIFSTFRVRIPNGNLQKWRVRNTRYVMI